MTDKAKPIIFTSESVKAILAGKKTQSRRVVIPQPPSPEAVKKLAGDTYSFMESYDKQGWFKVVGPVWAVRELDEKVANAGITSLWKKGDHLWVREAFDWVAGRRVTFAPGKEPVRERFDHVIYRANGGSPPSGKWSSPLFMPRWASRLTLEVTAVRVERLRDITDADALAEGIDDLTLVKRKTGERWMAFSIAWDNINGKKHPWESNPFVWVIEFKKA